MGSSHVYDRLPLTEWRHGFLGRWSELAAGVADEPPAIAGLGALRGILRRLLEAVARGEPPAAQDVEALNRVLAASPRTRRLEGMPGDRQRMVEAPSRYDWRWALAEVASSAAELLAAGEPRRLRVCANPDCSWMFYDESRSGSRRWCEGTICGSLVKVRRHRATHRPPDRV